MKRRERGDRRIAYRVTRLIAIGSEFNLTKLLEALALT